MSEDKLSKLNNQIENDLYLKHEDGISAIAKCDSLSSLNNIKISYLGKKGFFTELLKQLGSLPQNERPKFGQLVNNCKKQFQEKLEQRHQYLSTLQIQSSREKDQLDITLPGRTFNIGKKHPITQTLEHINSFFIGMGFSVKYGLEIESDDNNFTKLNIPEHHPARLSHDTFYIQGNKKKLLRTHTSPVQIATLINAIQSEKGLPLRMIAPGKVYRCDSDVTHTPMFHQVEGLLVDKNISVANLKGTLEAFLNYFFGRVMPTRFRTSYFPFTEPSAEVDIECVKCLGNGCRICKNTGWLEVLGCGMVHPAVFQNCGLDAKHNWSGFAFGMGVERFAMLKYGISDLRWFFENDLRFLRQF